MKRPATFKWETLAYISVWLIAFVLRLTCLLQIGNVPASDLLVGDAVTYHAWGSRIAAGDWIGTGVFYQAPLYPYFLGLLYTIIGSDLFSVRLVQIALGAGSCVLLARAGSSFFGRTAPGLLAGLILAAYPTAIFFDCSIQKSVLDLFLTCSLLAVMGRLHDRPLTRRWLAAGLILALLALTRENALIFPPIVLAWLFLAWRGELWKTRLKWAGAVLLGLGAILLPVGYRNLRVGGEFHLTTSQFGPNFYIGNSRAATGTYVPLREGRGSALFEREDATNLAEQTTGRKMTPSEVSSFWTTRAFEEIRADIPKWLSLVWRKWLLVWNISEVGDSDDQYTFGDWSPVLGALNPLLHFGTLCPLVALGICITWNRRNRLWPLYAMILAYAGSVTLFYVFSRYRFPLVPLLILFAAAGLVFALAAFREARRPLWAGAVAAVVAAFVCNQAMMPEALIRADTHNSLGNAFILKGEMREAIRQYEQALEWNPTDPYVPFNLSAALLQAGRYSEAIKYCEQALRVDPNDRQAHHNLGIALLHVGRPENAVRHIEQALRINPEHVEARVLLGSVLYDLGRVSEAMAQWEQVLQIEPALAEAHYNLGNAFLRERRLDKAIEHYGAAARLKPELAEVHCNFGIALEQAGRIREAVEHYEQAVLLRPDLEEVQQRLAVLRNDPRMKR